MHDDIDLQTGRAGGRPIRPTFQSHTPQRERLGIMVPPIISMIFAVVLKLYGKQIIDQPLYLFPVNSEE